MRGTMRALRVEWLKARRSPVPAVTAGVLTLAAGMEALFMFVFAHPDTARAMGVLGQKAQLFGMAANWPSLLAFGAQVMAVGGLIVFAFCGSWVFGREFADGTARYLLALPISREKIVAAKLVLLVLWCGGLDVWFVALNLAVGLVMGLPGGGVDVAVAGSLRILLAAALQLGALAPVVLVASVGRGYLPPLATALGMIVVAQVAGALGWAAVVPWAVPAVAAGLVPGLTLEPVGLVAVGLCGLLGVAGTILWWRGGDAGA